MYCDYTSSRISTISMYSKNTLVAQILQNMTQKLAVFVKVPPKSAHTLGYTPPLYSTFQILFIEIYFKCYSFSWFPIHKPPITSPSPFFYEYPESSLLLSQENFLICMDLFFSVYIMYTQTSSMYALLTEGRRGHQTFWNWNY